MCKGILWLGCPARADQGSSRCVMLARLVDSRLARVFLCLRAASIQTFVRLQKAAHASTQRQQRIHNFVQGLRLPQLLRFHGALELEGPWQCSPAERANLPAAYDKPAAHTGVHFPLMVLAVFSEFCRQASGCKELLTKVCFLTHVTIIET